MCGSAALSRVLTGSSRIREPASFPFPYSFPALCDYLAATGCAVRNMASSALVFRLSLDGSGLLLPEPACRPASLSFIRILYSPLFSPCYQWCAYLSFRVCCLCILPKPAFRCLLCFMNFIVPVTLLFFYCKGRCQLHHE